MTRPEGPHSSDHARRRPPSRHAVLLLATFSLGALCACAKPPQAEMQAAQAALEKAKSTGADIYAPEAWSHAQESLAQAKAEMDAQTGRFGILRSYDKTRQLILKVQGDAAKAGNDAATAKVQVQLEAQSGIVAAKSALAEANAALATAPAGKDRKADTEAIRADIEALKGLETEAETAFAAENFVTAKQRAGQVRQKATDIVADIAAARAKAQART